MMFGKKDELSKMILSNEDFLAKALNIGVTVDRLMAEVNAYDWMELQETNEHDLLADFKKRTGFQNPDNESIRDKAFAHKLRSAIENLSALMEEVNTAYKIPSSGGVSNPEIAKYYYLKYWADKKGIAVDYNETEYNKRKLFNFYSILFDIFANNLENFNAYNKQQKHGK